MKKNFLIYYLWFLFFLLPVRSLTAAEESVEVTERKIPKFQEKKKKETSLSKKKRKKKLPKKKFSKKYHYILAGGGSLLIITIAGISFYFYKSNSIKLPKITKCLLCGVEKDDDLGDLGKFSHWESQGLSIDVHKYGSANQELKDILEREKIEETYLPKEYTLDKAYIHFMNVFIGNMYHHYHSKEAFLNTLKIREDDEGVNSILKNVDTEELFSKVKLLGNQVKYLYSYRNTLPVKTDKKEKIIGNPSTKSGRQHQMVKAALVTLSDIDYLLDLPSINQAIINENQEREKILQEQLKMAKEADAQKREEIINEMKRVINTYWEGNITSKRIEDSINEEKNRLVELNKVKKCVDELDGKVKIRMNGSGWLVNEENNQTIGTNEYDNFVDRIEKDAKSFFDKYDDLKSKVEEVEKDESNAEETINSLRTLFDEIKKFSQTVPYSLRNIEQRIKSDLRIGRYILQLAKNPDLFPKKK